MEGACHMLHNPNKTSILSGPVGEFMMNSHGNSYTIRDTILHCEQSGGQMMVVSYLEVNDNNFHFKYIL